MANPIFPIKPPSTPAEAAVKAEAARQREAQLTKLLDQEHNQRVAERAA
jgi:hypothetical protein